MSDAASMRLDLWLKFSCVFKQRSAAVKACDAGHVRVNDQRAKPAGSLKVGDRIEITGEHPRILIVVALAERSIAKELARALYEDRTPVVEKDARPDLGIREKGAGRPSKRERREIEKWRL